MRLFELVRNMETDFPELKMTYEYPVDFNDFEDDESAESINDVGVYFFEIDKAMVEKCYVVARNSKRELEDQLGAMLLSSGDDKQCFPKKKQLATFLLMFDADEFFLLHNHPSGNVEWSDDDLEWNEDMKMLAETIDIPLIDNVIVTRKGYSSLMTREKVYRDKE